MDMRKLCWTSASIRSPPKWQPAPNTEDAKATFVGRSIRWIARHTAEEGIIAVHHMVMTSLILRIDSVRHDDGQVPGLLVKQPAVPVGSGSHIPTPSRELHEHQSAGEIVGNQSRGDLRVYLANDGVLG